MICNVAGTKRMKLYSYLRIISKYFSFQTSPRTTPTVIIKSHVPTMQCPLCSSMMKCKVSCMSGTPLAPPLTTSPESHSIPLACCTRKRCFQNKSPCSKLIAAVSRQVRVLNSPLSWRPGNYMPPAGSLGKATPHFIRDEVPWMALLCPSSWAWWIHPRDPVSSYHSLNVASVLVTSCNQILYLWY